MSAAQRIYDEDRYAYDHDSVSWEPRVVSGGRREIRRSNPVAMAVSLALAAACAAAFIGGSWAVGSAERASYERAVAGVTYHAVTVSSTDSLWSIAQQAPVPGLSTDQVAQLIRQRNDMGSQADVVPGASVLVPMAG